MVNLLGNMQKFLDLISNGIHNTLDMVVHDDNLLSQKKIYQADKLNLLNKVKIDL